MPFGFGLDLGPFFFLVVSGQFYVHDGRGMRNAEIPHHICT